MTRPASTHWLRENASVRSPRRVLVVDTETRPIAGSDPARHVLRLWCARLLRRRGIDPKLPRVEDYAGLRADELVDRLEQLARSDAALWVFTHNLNFDLAVTALPVLLTERGWRITEGALTTDDPWCRLAKRSKRLTIADSWSYLPTSVEAIGELIGRRKQELPAWDDDDAAWYVRCRSDTEIVAEALEQLMDWWDAGAYGNWSITGPSTGWSSFRHRKPRPHVLVEPDPVARALEHRAVTGGRREVRRLGRLPLGLYADLDLATAHLTVMSERKLPARRLHAFEQLELDDRRLSSDVLDVLAECELETAAPRYAWDSGRGVFYPRGRFRSVLAGPEIRAARARDELRSIGRGYVYLMGWHMQSWARWLATLLDPTLSDAPPTVRLIAKHWSRCVPGKWAGHTSEVVARRPDPRPGWQIERGFVAAPRRPADFLLVGGELWTIARDEWADDAFPAVLAWIQSYTRLAVGRLLDQLGPAALSVNTDGIMVDVRELLDWTYYRGVSDDASPTAMLRFVDELCAEWDAYLAPFTARIKQACRRVTIISPQHLVLDGERRLAGIPRRAVELDGGRFRFTAWPRLRVQLNRPAPPGYATQERTVDLGAIPPNGWRLASGEVIPVEVRTSVDGTTAIEPPEPERYAPLELAPARLQHPLLRRLLPPDPPSEEPQEAVSGPDWPAEQLEAMLTP